MGEWPKLTFDDAPLEIIDGDRGVNYPKQSDFSKIGHCLFLNAGNVTNSGFSFTECSFIDQERDRILRKGKLRRFDVVLTTRGTVGNVGFFDESIPYEHVRINSGMVIFRPDQSRIIARYLYLFLRSQLFRDQVIALTTGSAQPQLPIRDIQKIRIPLPPVCEQRAIAETLGALDDKIELNRQTNETLEELARSFFKDWFVDFGPTRAKAEGRTTYLAPEIWHLFPNALDDEDKPVGWCIRTIADICEVVDCLHSKKPSRQPEGKPLLQLSNIRDDGLIDLADRYCISDSDYEQWISRIEASEGDCVITNVGRVGAVSQMPPGVKAALGRNMTGVRCRQDFQHPTFLICLLLSEAMKNEIENWLDTGTILNALNVRSIPKLRFLMPDRTAIQYFESVARPLRQKMEYNLIESRTLAQTRDLLLPKLMSGEIRLREAEKLVEAVA